jgi:hypothetical protein
VDEQGKVHQYGGPFDIFVLYEKIHTGIGNALIDTGAQV